MPVHAIPKCPVMAPWLRSLRSELRLRNLFKNQTVQLKNRISSMLMEWGIEYNPRKLHTKRYYEELLRSSKVPDSIKPALRLCRSRCETTAEAQKSLVRKLEREPQIVERVKRLQTIPGVGRMMALTWALEIGDVTRFRSANKAISYYGLVSAENGSAGKNKGGPLSKKRNGHLQTMLIEVASSGSALQLAAGGGPAAGRRRGCQRGGDRGGAQAGAVPDGGRQKRQRNICSRQSHGVGSCRLTTVPTHPEAA